MKILFSSSKCLFLLQILFKNNNKKTSRHSPVPLTSLVLKKTKKNQKQKYQKKNVSFREAFL